MQDESLGPAAGGIWIGALFEDCVPALGKAAANLGVEVVPAGETVRIVGSAGPGRKAICVDIAGPASVEEVIRHLLPDALPGESAAGKAAFAARHGRSSERVSQHHRLMRLEPLGRDPADGATLVKATVSTFRHYIVQAAAERGAAPPVAAERVDVCVERSHERERERAASAPRAADTLGPQGKSRRLGSGKR